MCGTLDEIKGFPVCSQASASSVDTSWLFILQLGGGSLPLGEAFPLVLELGMKAWFRLYPMGPVWRREPEEEREGAGREKPYL